MNIIVLKNYLKEGLGSVERSVGDNLNLPILKNILIKTENNRINFYSTNLELAITHSLSGKVIENGVLSVPLNLFSSLVNNLTSERITLSRKGLNLFIKTDNYEAVIQGLNPDDFPIIPKIVKAVQEIKIDSGIFKDALLKTLNAAQFTELRPELNGVFIHCGMDHLRLAATDSFRLAEKIIGSGGFSVNHEGGAREAIIPLKTAQEAARILKSGEELRILLDENQILFKCGDVEIISRLIDGKFPDYQAIIPKTVSFEVRLSKAELVNALKLTGIFTGRVHDVRMHIGENNKFMEVHSADSSLGENKYFVPIATSGSSLNIAFNWRYLMDGLKPFASDDVVFGINGSDKPVIIKDPGDKSFFYILMPIKN